MEWMDGHAWIQSLGIICGLGFTALGFRADAQSRRSENLIRITEGHRELWTRYDETPALHRILDPEALIEVEPVTPAEARFVQFLILHIHLTFQLSKGGVYQQPDRLREDVKSLFVLPIPKQVWTELKPFQNADFVKFMESCLKTR